MTDLKASITVELIDEVSARAAAVSASMEGVESATREAGAGGAASIDRLDRAMEGANASARQLSQSSGVLAAAQQRAAQTSSSAGAAMTGALASGTGAASRGIFSVTDASKKQGLAMAQNLNLVSELALGFSTLSPATRGLGIAFASAGNNAFALGGALGPMGVALGTAIGILPAAIGLFSSFGDEMDSTADSTERAAQSLDDFINLARERQAEAARQSRFDMGLETAEEAQGATLQAQDRAATRQAELLALQTSLGASPTAQNEIARLMTSNVPESDIRSTVLRLAQQGDLDISTRQTADGLVEDQGFIQRNFAGVIPGVGGSDATALTRAILGSRTAGETLSERRVRQAAAERDLVEGQTDEVLFADDEAAARRRRRSSSSSLDMIRRARSDSPTAGLGGASGPDRDSVVNLNLTVDGRPTASVSIGQGDRIEMEAAAEGPL